MKPGWFIEKYDEDHYGLKCTEPHDGRGVPEGTRLEWAAVISAMRIGAPFGRKRLAYNTVDGITSPRNTNKGNTPHDERYLIDDPRQMADWLEQRFEVLRDAPESTQSPAPIPQE